MRTSHRALCMSTINSDEYDAEHGVRSGHRAAAGARASRQARGVIVCSINREKQRGDVKRAGASARTSEHDRAPMGTLIVIELNQKKNRYWYQSLLGFQILKRLYAA